jgi:hypothetical protein
MGQFERDKKLIDFGEERDQIERRYWIQNVTSDPTNHLDTGRMNLRWYVWPLFTPVPSMC